MEMGATRTTGPTNGPQQRQTFQPHDVSPFLETSTLHNVPREWLRKTCGYIVKISNHFLFQFTVVRALKLMNCLSNVKALVMVRLKIYVTGLLAMVTKIFLLQCAMSGANEIFSDEAQLLRGPPVLAGDRR